MVPSRASRHGSPDEQGRYGSPGKQIHFWLITDILCIPRPNDLPRQPLGLFCARFCDRESLGAPFVQDFAIGRVGPNRKCRILRSGEPNTAKDASEVLSIAKSCTLSPERQARARAEGPDAAQAKKHTHERKQAATRPRSGQQKTDAPATAGCVPDGISSRWPTRKAAGASAIRKNARQYDGNRPNRR